MTYKATIVELPDVNLAVNRADRFPEGIEAAWKDLESKLTTLKGRRFYGLTVCEGDGLAYFAGVETSDHEEIGKLGLPTMMIKSGRYARVKLNDWRNHKDDIGKIFDQLMQDHDMDPDGACIEFYRSLSELHICSSRWRRRIEGRTIAKRESLHSILSFERRASMYGT